MVIPAKTDRAALLSAVLEGEPPRGASLQGVGRRPVILQRTDQELIDAVFRDLRTSNGRRNAASTIARERTNSLLRLYQPVHRIFHVVLLQVVCERFGFPRVDPSRIESAGLVVRRVVPPPRRKGSRSLRLEKPSSTHPEELTSPRLEEARSRRRKEEKEVLEGWLHGDGRVLGWIPFDSSSDMDRDPDPDLRPAGPGTGNATIDRLLAARRATSTPAREVVSPLFVAPPDVCEAAGATLLYGLVPVSSSEVSEAGTPSTYPPESIEAMLPSFLKGPAYTPPLAGALLDKTHATEGQLKEFIGELTFLVAGLDLFGATSKPLFDMLERVSVTVRSGTVRTLGTHLRSLSNVLLDRRGTVRMPASFPSVDASTRAAVATELGKIANARLAALSPQEGRYAQHDRTYRLRAFARIRSHGGCGPQLCWSADSEEFSITPWYETGDRPPIQITLPTPSIANLKKLKPTVSFVSEPSLFNKIKSISLNDLLDGNEPREGSGALKMICGFNIPIVTLCALIVLSIFLGLLNMVFFWLPYVFICLPLPDDGNG